MFAIIIKNEDTKDKNILFLMKRGKKIEAKIKIFNTERTDNPFMTESTKILLSKEASKFLFSREETSFENPGLVFKCDRSNFVEISDSSQELEEDI